jgi:hypothetical protein
MGARPGTNFTVDDLDYIGREREERFDEWGTSEILTEYKNRISVGQPMDGISELGNLHRQLLQESDYFAGGKVVLKKLSPDEENERFKFNAIHLPSDTKTIILGLEEAGINTNSLKSAIKLAAEDKEVIKWITKHWETFVSDDAEDALFNAENGLLDIKDSGELSFQEEKYLSRDTGYQKDSYQLVEVFRKSFFKEAAERRKVTLKARLRDIQKCQTPQQVEEELQRTRDAYTEDKALVELWSPKWKAIDREDYLDSLHRRRRRQEELLARHIDSFNRMGKLPEKIPRYKREVLDFESIRRKMWFCFDRQRGKKETETQMKAVRPGWIAEVDPKTGKISEDGFRTDEECLKLIKNRDADPRNVVVEKIVTPLCLWDADKSRAFCKKIQTQAQWSRTYNYLWERMNTTISWKLYNLKKYQDGVKLCDFIRRYQFRLDPDMLGKEILNKAKKAKTEKGRDLIRLFLASCQYRLSKEIKKEIIREISWRSL